MLDPLVGKILAIGFGLMLLFASLHKLANTSEFRAILLDYRLLPPAIVPAAAVALPVIEAGIGLSWLFATPSAGPAFATAALLLLYSTGLVINLLRGRVHISCGCGFGTGAGAGDTLSWSLVARNAILAGAALVAALPASSRTLGAVDYATLVAALITGALLFSAANQLLRNSAAIRSWRRPAGRDG